MGNPVRFETRLRNANGSTGAWLTVSAHVKLNAPGIAATVELEYVDVGGDDISAELTDAERSAIEADAITWAQELEHDRARDAALWDRSNGLDFADVFEDVDNERSGR